MQTLGGPCVTKNDCEGGNTCAQGVCCFTSCDGLCQTCNGSHPGTCETKAAGSVCQAAKCANGMLSTVAQCSADAQCSYNGGKSSVRRGSRVCRRGELQDALLVAVGLPRSDDEVQPRWQFLYTGRDVQGRSSVPR